MSLSYDEFNKYLDENEGIIEKVKSSLSIRTDTELAEKLGVANSSITNARKTRTPDRWILYSLFTNPIPFPTFLYSSEKLLRSISGDKIVKVRIISNIYYEKNAFMEQEEGIVYSSLNRIFSRINNHNEIDLVYYYIQTDLMSPTVRINDTVIINKKFRNDLISNKIMIMHANNQILIGRPQFQSGKIIINFDNPDLDPIETTPGKVKFYGMLVQLQRKMDI